MAQVWLSDVPCSGCIFLLSTGMLAFYRLKMAALAFGMLSRAYTSL